MKINRDQGHVELNDAPAFDYGEKVRSRMNVRNDGTFPGKEVGDILVKKDEIGYVTSIGTFLQQFYIYGVEFVVSGHRVGMKGRELDSLDAVAHQPGPGSQAYERAKNAQICLGPAGGGRY